MCWDLSDFRKDMIPEGHVHMTEDTVKASISQVVDPTALRKNKNQKKK